jgi:DNA-binding NarL/FixJ family response regulator/putative methionine-R-sulfoxide reductase with GAF domain
MVRATYNPENHRGGVTVNPTARWPERLEHLATLLRADAMAVVSAGPDGPTAIFTHRLETPLDWFAVLGSDVFDRADRGPFVTPVPSGRWIESAGYAVIAPVESLNGDAILVALRQEVGFDAIDAAAAAAAGRLLEMSALEGRALAETLRQSSALEQRLEVLAGIGDELAHARDASAVLARATQEVARRMGAGAASIMVVEGDQLRLRASVGLSSDAAAGLGQRVGEGVAGWVAANNQKVVLHGRVDDARFIGTDPDARESVSVPLKDGPDVLGVLSIKRPDQAHGFEDRHELLEAVALDLGRALRAMNTIAEAERGRAAAHEEAAIARAVAAGDGASALRATLALGHHAVAVRDRAGGVIGVESLEGDDRCREEALAASSRVKAEAATGATIGFARHGSSYQPEEGELAQRTADTLALLGRGLKAEAAAPVLRVLAVEDHPVMRMGVRAMLEREGFVVAGATATCAEAIGMLAEARADVALLDLRLPDATGAEAVIRLRESAPALPIVVFSVERTPALIRAVLRAGANGYVTKDAPVARIVAALHAAVAGLVALGPEEAIAAAGAAPTESPHPNGEERASQPEPVGTNGAEALPHEPLTPRELELLRYMAEGYTNKEVARAMVLAEDTVKKAVQTLIAKLGAADRTNAVVLALRNHLID